MKKIIPALCAVLAALALASCGGGDSFDATVLDVQKNERSESALVETVQPLEGGSVHRELIWVSVSPGAMPALSPGDTVTVRPDGEIMETHPAQLQAKSVKLKEKAAGALWGTVQEVNGASLLVDRLERTETGFAAKDGGELFTVDVGQVEFLPEIRAGDTVLIRFDGEILETYPMQIRAEAVVCWDGIQAILGTEG